MKNGKRILSVTVKHLINESPDTSHLGEYGTRAESQYAIDRHHAEDCQSIKPTNDKATGILESASEYLEEQYPEDGGHLGAAMREAIGIDDAIKTLDDARDSVTACDCNKSFDSYECQYFNPCFENYAGLPEDEIRKYCRQDFERAESLNRGEWQYIGIRAEAEIELTPDGRPQTITSGGLWGIESDSGDYIAEVTKDELADLKTQLRAIGFSARAIATAYKTIKTEEI